MVSALTVAGSDPSGGAGIQADLRTFAIFGVRGYSVVTALTAQHSRGILGVEPTPPEFVALQLEAVMVDGRPLAMKTGMLGTSGAVEEIARFIRQYRIGNVVVDPVLVSTSGTPLIEPSALETLTRLLIPLATLITPNLSEAEVLTGLKVHDTASMEEAARRIVGMGARAALIKGGHLDGDAVDVLFDGGQFHHFREPRIPAVQTHGTGCVLSASITARLACGDVLVEAVRVGKETITETIRRNSREG
ncbi:MAG TPA: bifunctional hydroxymethylpyrimidine kinase/phosphomethylpyrimidine kinase [Terriglobia bacterium]|nr:bifunctional hydroxymethylpyrimidine kinase/phosphomethylpyrimidine kinase [Terriglobia bacterium]